MTLSVWRPLKDAPKDRRQYVHPNGAQVAEWGAENGWAYWLNGYPVSLRDEQPSLPIADTYELDRAVQVKIAEAFGALIQGLKDGHGAWGRYFNDYIAEGECDRLRSLGLLAFRRILHPAMGGRIPDEVP